VLGELLEASAALIEADRTPANRDDWVCARFCEIVENGKIADFSVWNGIVAALTQPLSYEQAMAVVAATVGEPKLMAWYTLGTNNPDSDHEILCTECPPELGPWTYAWDFALSDGGWANDFPEREDVGLYVPGSGWQGTFWSATSNGNRGVYITKPTPDINIDTARIIFTHSESRGGAWKTEDSNPAVVFTGAAGNNDITVTTNWLGVDRILMHITTGNEYANLLITRIEIGGVGEPPIGLTGGSFQ